MGLAYGEQVIEIDMREDDSSEGYYVLFCSRYVQERSHSGDAFVVLARGQSSKELRVERAFGLHVAKGIPRLNELSIKQVNAARDSKGDPEPVALIVQSDKARYDAVKEVIEKWARQEIYEYPLAVENTDMTLAIAGILGLYPPYRRAWQPTNPITYYVDLGKLNRKMGRKP